MFIAYNSNDKCDRDFALKFIDFLQEHINTGNCEENCKCEVLLRVLSKEKWNGNANDEKYSYKRENKIVKKKLKLDGYNDEVNLYSSS